MTSLLTPFEGCRDVSGAVTMYGPSYLDVGVVVEGRLGEDLVDGARGLGVRALVILVRLGVVAVYPGGSGAGQVWKEQDLFQKRLVVVTLFRELKSRLF